MPFIVDLDTTEVWLDKKFDNYEALLKAIQPFPENQIQVSPVTIKVNKVENDYAELLKPIRAHVNLVQEELFR